MRLSELLIFFFFSRHDTHPDLHSFPTRRSSDLRPTTDAAGQCDAQSADVAPNARARGELSGCPTREPGRKRNAAADRKSTRLNSSHRCISYAVFCLKKKKTKQKKKNLYSKQKYI